VTERPGRIEYLYLTSEQRVTVQQLNDRIDELPPLTKLRCQIPEVKVLHGKTVEYYPHMDYDERIPPTEEQADLLCRTEGIMCPLAAYCNRAGMALEAPVGVWGGRVLVDGKDYYTKEVTND
jgi:hypothetical protein